MTPHDAVKVLVQAVRAVNTDWNGHMTMQQAIKVLSDLIPKEPTTEG